MSEKNIMDPRADRTSTRLGKKRIPNKFATFKFPSKPISKDRNEFHERKVQIIDKSKFKKMPKKEDMFIGSLKLL